MLIEKLAQGTNFTNHEREVAGYILENLDKVPGMSSTELAQASFTSKATVVRLSKKLGLSGYQELRLKLVEEMNQKNRLSQMLEGEPIHDKSTYSDIIHTLPVLYDKAITNTRLSLDKNVMNRINHVLQRAECIDIYGAGISYILAQSASFKFATLGMESSAYESINGHYLAARRNKKTLAFLISFTGANRTMIRAAEYLRKATNNHVVGVVGPHKEAIQKWCHEIVEIPNRDSLVSLDVITSFSAATFVMDIFFSLLLSARYHQHAKSSLEMLLHNELLLDKTGIHE
ncbi:hypothetical protein C806_03519 [Lachnospiraceae bacterium 3-1]|nr:hypothetical protein C806_03519 [Lachnospiraceae bacterium 3-1]